MKISRMSDYLFRKYSKPKSAPNLVIHGLAVPHPWMTACISDTTWDKSAEILHGIVSYNCLFTHQNSSISEMVRWGPLVDLTWHDPYICLNFPNKFRKLHKFSQNLLCKIFSNSSKDIIQRTFKNLPTFFGKKSSKDLPKKFKKFGPRNLLNNPHIWVQSTWRMGSWRGFNLVHRGSIRATYLFIQAVFQ